MWKAITGTMSIVVFLRNPLSSYLFSFFFSLSPISSLSRSFPQPQDLVSKYPACFIEIRSAKYWSLP